MASNKKSAARKKKTKTTWADKPARYYPYNRTKTNEKQSRTPDFGISMNAEGMSVPHDKPLVPFSVSYTKLQNRIPFHLLPKKLFIHDPWDLLKLKMRYSDVGVSRDWSEKQDVVHIYALDLSENDQEVAKQEEAKQEKRKAERADSTDVRHLHLPCPLDAKSGPILPPHFIDIPSYSSGEAVQEAHLYLSPMHKAGTGSHCAAYIAEWEVPQSLLNEDSCQSCLDERITAELAKQDGKDGSNMDAKWKVKGGMATRIDLEGKEEACDHNSESESGMMCYKGPVRHISPISRPKHNCKHQQNDCSHVHPLTAKVRVVAKLATQRDGHLQNEAKNYQKFPARMFEQQNELNCVTSMQDPVSLDALVPQFYGYYVPENQKSGEYMSPIVLLEDCGKPISVVNLDVDKRRQCASLVRRFNAEGWIHGSLYERNIVQQARPISDMPSPFTNSACQEEGEISFRLIDFGRSLATNSTEIMSQEGERTIRYLFYV